MFGIKSGLADIQSIENNRSLKTQTRQQDTLLAAVQALVREQQETNRLLRELVR